MTFGVELGSCNLCGFPVIRATPKSKYARCINCLSTEVHRAIGSEIIDLNFKKSARVYELSSRGALVKYLKKNFKDLCLSEYFDDVPLGGKNGGIACQDVQKLTYVNNSFDLVTSTEVFEHVANDLQGFSEIYRVLAKNGYFIFTVPLYYGETTIERAFIKDDGSIENILEPEYHGDRIRGKNKVLAFRNYGTDIKDRLESVGFFVEIKKIYSKENCINDQSVIIAKKQ